MSINDRELSDLLFKTVLLLRSTLLSDVTLCNREDVYTHPGEICILFESSSSKIKPNIQQAA